MTAPTPLLDDQTATIAFLMSGCAFGTPPERRIDTHAAIIFLVGDRAWKMKRAVRFPYFDFSTAERRRSALAAELTLNRRTAPMLYHAVHPINRSGANALAIDGPGAPIDWLLEMQRFPDDALLSAVAGRGALDDALSMRLADSIAAFHDSAEIASCGDGLAAMCAIIDGNRASMRRFPDLFPEAAVEGLHRRTLDAAVNARALLDRRAAGGRVRHCHGDLHLANIVLIGSDPILFDCLEFDPALATIDLLYDLAFLLMDLWRIGLRRQANIVFNRYLDVSADDGGAPLIPLFMAIRATIRAHVHAARARDAEAAAQARSYLMLANALLAPVAPRLVAIGGLSGTGKSTVARGLGGAIGRAPGARIVRSDVVRKQLAGVRPEQRLMPASYTATASRLVYARLAEQAGAILASGQSVVADAMFAARDERDAIDAVAQSARARFDGFWLEAPAAVRAERVAQRITDASDADAAIARQQQPVPVDQLGDWHRIDATGASAAAITAIAGAIARS